MAEQIRVLLADDHPLIQEGIGNTLQNEEDLSLVGVAPDGHSCQQQCAELKPDVVLLDLNMPGPTALETIASIRRTCPDTRIVVLSAYDDYIAAHALVEAGVHGYVLKEEPPIAVIRAIRTVVGGGAWFSQTIARQLAKPVPSGPQFTERETDVLNLLALGWSNERIASQLSVTERTVRYHLRNIYNELGVETRGAAIAWAVRKGYGVPRKA